MPAQAQSLTGIAVPEDGEGDGAGAGDLRFNVECLFEVSGEGFLSGDFYLEVGGQVELYYPFDGWVQDGDLINYSDIVPAATSNRNIDCWGSTNVGYFQSPTVVLEGSGPLSQNFKVAAFIRYDWVNNPYTPGVLIFGGDNRSWSSSTSASRRIQSTIGLLNPAVSNGTYLNPPAHSAGQTREYDKGTSLSGGIGCSWPSCTVLASAKTDTVWGWPLATRWETASTAPMNCNSWRNGPNPTAKTSQSQTSCNADMPIPLAENSPRVQWAFTLTLDWGNNKVKWLVQGCTTYFPSHEFYLGSTPIYQNIDSGNPFGLFLGCTEHVDRNGEV